MHAFKALEAHDGHKACGAQGLWDQPILAHSIATPGTCNSELSQHLADMPDE